MAPRMAANASKAPEAGSHALSHRYPRTTDQRQVRPNAGPGRRRPTPGAPCSCLRKEWYSASFRSADLLLSSFRDALKVQTRNLFLYHFEIPGSLAYASAPE